MSFLIDGLRPANAPHKANEGTQAQLILSREGKLRSCVPNTRTVDNSPSAVFLY